MITDNTYYVDELYIAHAKPSITSDVTTVGSDLSNFIYEYEREALIKCLSLTLFNEFEKVLDKSKANGLIDTADQKWDDLLNGVEYVDARGKTVSWRGIRYKLRTADTKPTKSFLANYVFYYFERDFANFKTGNGVMIAKGKSFKEANPTAKITRAWRKMVKMIQGEEAKPKIIRGVGIDWFIDNGEITLYKYIRDINEITPDTYANFVPYTWDGTLNQFGI